MLDIISPVLSDFLTGFQRNPMDARETTELHKELFSALYRQFAEEAPLFELERSRLQMAYQSHRKKMILNPIRTAYPPKEKFDIVALDTTAEPPTEVTGDAAYQAYWQQPLAFALNLHLCSEEEQIAKYLKAQTKDLKKMKAYQAGMPAPEQFTGLSLLLVNTFLEDEPGPEIPWDLQSGIQAWVVTEDQTFLQVIS